MVGCRLPRRYNANLRLTAINRDWPVDFGLLQVCKLSKNVLFRAHAPVLHDTVGSQSPASGDEDDRPGVFRSRLWRNPARCPLFHQIARGKSRKRPRGAKSVITVRTDDCTIARRLWKTLDFHRELSMLTVRCLRRFENADGRKLIVIQERIL